MDSGANAAHSGEMTAATSIETLSPLRRRAARILIAAAEPMMPSHPKLEADERAAVDAEMALFLVRQVFSMPRYLLAPFLLALVGFDLLPRARGGRSFSALRADQRAAIVASWAGSRIAQKRDLIKLIRNCALYYYLDHPLVRARLEAEDGAAHVA